MEDLVERLRHIKNWNDLETEDRFWALKQSGLLPKSGLEEFSFDAAIELAEEEGSADVDDLFLTDPEDLACPYYRFDEIRVMEGVELLDNLAGEYPILADHDEDFSLVSRLIETADKRKSLDQVAEESRAQDDLASPEQVLSRRTQGRFL